jgi:hypothetical protein
MQKNEQKPNATPENDGDGRGGSDPSMVNKPVEQSGNTQENRGSTAKPEPTEKSWSRPVSDTIKAPNAQSSGVGVPDNGLRTPDSAESKGVPVATPPTPKVDRPTPSPKAETPKDPSTPAP